MIVPIIIAIAVVSLLTWFFIWKAKYVNNLRKIRDDFDLTTPEGRFLCKVYNKKINDLNGYNAFRK